MDTCTRLAYHVSAAFGIEVHLQTKIPTYHFQNSMPKLKIPKLEETLGRVCGPSYAINFSFPVVSQVCHPTRLGRAARQDQGLPVLSPSLSSSDF
jgi:hypothetical protein